MIQVGPCVGRDYVPTHTPSCPPRARFLPRALMSVEEGAQLRVALQLDALAPAQLVDRVCHVGRELRVALLEMPIQVGRFAEERSFRLEFAACDLLLYVAIEFRWIESSHDP